jgi:hypothetical protein
MYIYLVMIMVPVLYWMLCYLNKDMWTNTSVQPTATMVTTNTSSVNYDYGKHILTVLSICATENLLFVQMLISNL